MYLITSRPDYLKDKTIEQIERHFGDSFSGLFFSSNHYTKRKNSGKSKAEICLDLRVSKLIDDSLEYALQCAEKGLEVFLLSNKDTPWNQNGEYKGITRVKNWKEIWEVLK